MKPPAECTLEELRPYASEFLRLQRLGKPGRPKVMRPCPKCGREYGRRERRLHLPLCGKS